jgi:hypothetical protein
MSNPQIPLKLTPPSHVELQNDIRNDDHQNPTKDLIKDSNVLNNPNDLNELNEFNLPSNIDSILDKKVESIHFDENEKDIMKIRQRIFQGERTSKDKNKSSKSKSRKDKNK